LRRNERTRKRNSREGKQIHKEKRTEHQNGNTETPALVPQFKQSESFVQTVFWLLQPAAHVLKSEIRQTEAEQTKGLTVDNKVGHIKLFAEREKEKGRKRERIISRC